MGRMVVLGRPHPTLLPHEARPRADALVIGEAETTWPQLADAVHGALARECRADEPPSLERVPRPRRDLIVGRGLLANTVIATRRRAPGASASSSASSGSGARESGHSGRSR